MMTFAMIAAAWPLVTMRQMGATTFAPSNLNALVEIHVRHRGAVDEFWLADGTPRPLSELTDLGAWELATVLCRMVSHRESKEK